MKIFLKTYGCQMNERDSEAISAQLIRAGHSITGSEADADVMLFNTCSVRDAAERKAKGKISYMKKMKLRNPALIIGAMGCMAQRLGESLLAEIPHLDFVLGTGQLHRLIPLLEEFSARRKRFAAVEPSSDVLEGMGAHLYGNFSAQIAITRGCNRFCSYCIVPYVRGREISRSMEDILSEARSLVAQGTKEILLLGQNVAAYGLGGNVNPPPEDHSPFADLIEALDGIPGLLRLRYTSPYVTYFNRRLIEALAHSRTACRHIHLPLQSGSDRMLKAMNRQYTRESYLGYVERLRSAMPDLTFSTDVIVGFPGETEEDFRATREVMQHVGFEQAYVFKYSPRPGAKSATIADSVPEAVKEERNQILLADLADRIARKLAAAVGSTVEVLTEGVSARNPGRWTGRTSGNIVVHFEPVPGLEAGTLRQVKITRAGAVTLFGTLI